MTLSTNAPVQRVVFQPKAYQGFQRGINQIVNAIRPTLGPRSRLVASTKAVGGEKEPPELLDDGAVIARRIIELPDRDADMGAMFVRNVLWRLKEDAGDGTATAAVLFQAVYHHGVRHVVAGGNAMRVRHYLERGSHVILDELTRMTVRPKRGKEELAKIAESLCYDPPLAKMLGEVFDIIGEYGQLEVREGTRREVEREYVEGSYWDSGLYSRYMATDPLKIRTDFQDAAILITDLEIQDPADLVPVLQLAAQENIGPLVLMVRTLSESALNLLLANQQPGKLRLIAVKTPGATPDQIANAMQDMGMLTGARPRVNAAGDTLQTITPDDLGHARKAWADREYFGLIGGKGNAREMRAYIADLRAAHKGAGDQQIRSDLQRRLGKLLGGSATLWVGAATQSEIKTRKELAERTADALRGAVREGLLPGGGTALAACRPAIQRLIEQSKEEDERAAYRILVQALGEPRRVLIANAGYDVSHVMAELERAKQDAARCGFDVLTGQVVDMAQAGIWDVATVQKLVAQRAIIGAALALTVEVLVHHRKPVTDLEPK